MSKDIAVGDAIIKLGHLGLRQLHYDVPDRLRRRAGIAFARLASHEMIRCEHHKLPL